MNAHRHDADARVDCAHGTAGFGPVTQHGCAAFGRPDGSTTRTAGFTLVELMVVLVIVGLMGVAVVLTAPDDSRTLMHEADTLAARLVHASEEAILTARSVQVVVDPHGYAFARQSFGQWQPLDEGPFEPVAWAEGTTAVLDERRAQVSFRFDPTGGGTAQRVLLARSGERVEIAVDASGKVQVRAPR